MHVSFIRVSLSVNIIILIAVCIALLSFGTSQPVIKTWGYPNPSRGILLSIYISILFVSSVLLFLSLQNPISISTKYMVIALLIVQVVYKITTPFTVDITNPCVISNLLIAALHIVTLVFIWKES